MAALNADPEVMEFFPSTQSLEETKIFFQRVAKNFEDHGFCWYAVDVLKSREFIGFIGLAWCEMRLSLRLVQKLVGD